MHSVNTPLALYGLYGQHRSEDDEDALRGDGGLQRHGVHPLWDAVAPTELSGHGTGSILLHTDNIEQTHKGLI